MVSLRKLIPYSSALLLLLVVIGIYWLGNSQSGLNWVLRQAENIAPGTLKIGQAEGQLFSQINLKNIYFAQADGITLKVKKLDFSWHLLGLISRRLSINHLQMDSVSVIVPEQQKSDPDNKIKEKKIRMDQLPTIDLPVQVLINELALNHVQIRLKQATTPEQVIDITHLHFADIDLSSNLSINQAQLRIPAQQKIPALKLQWNTRTHLAPPYQLKLNGSWQADFPPGSLPQEQFPDGLTTMGNLEVRGDLTHINLKHQLTQPVALQLQADLYNLLQEIRWETDISWNELSWPIFEQVSNKAQLQLKQGKLSARGDLNNYQLNISTQLDGKKIPESIWKLEGKGDQSQFTIHELSGMLLDGELKSQGMVSWQPEIKADFKMNATSLHLNQWDVFSTIPLKTPMDSSLHINYVNQLLNIQDLKLTLPHTGATIQLGGQIAQIETEPQANMQLQWQNLNWPIVEQPSLIQSKQGKMDIQGGQNNYRVLIDTQLSGKDIPQGIWKGQVDGDLKHIEAFDLNGQLLGGQTHLTGHANWTDGIDWTVLIKGKDIHPDTQWPELPGVLNFNIDHQGKIYDEKLAAHVLVKELKGKIKGYPLRLKAEMDSDGKTHKLKQLDFYSGKNHINAQAELITAHSKKEPMIKAKFKIDAPNIATFLPHARGGIKGQGSVKGKLQQPTIKAKLTARNVSFQEWQLERFDSDIGFAPLQEGKLNLNLNIRKIKKHGEELIKQLSLTSIGKLEKHKINLSLNTVKENLSIQLDGAVKPTFNAWEGQLSHLKMDSELFGHWRLEVPTLLSISEQNIDLRKSCFKAKEHVGKLCSAVNWQRNQSAHIQADVEQLSMSQMLGPLLPPNVSLSGMILNGSLDTKLLQAPKSSLAGTGDNQTEPLNIDSRMNFSLSSGQLFTLLEGRQYLLPFKGADLNFDVDNRGLNGEVNAKLFNKSSIVGEIQLGEFKQLPINPKQPIKANLRAEFFDLDVLPSLSSAIKNTSGKIDLNVNAGGNLDAPKLQGQVSVIANTDIPTLGLELREIKTKLVTDKSFTKLNLTGSVQSGEGINRFDGMVDLSLLEKWQAQIKLYGEQFRAIHNDDFKVWIAPDLNLNIQPGQVEIAGRLTIPKARLTPQLNLEAGGSKVNASSDVLVMDDEKSELKQLDSAWKVKGKLDVLIGDDIRIDVADFKSAIEGKVSMIFDPDNLIPKGQGELNILDGTYKAYGQDLEISQGRVFFQGTPMDNPGLGIRAIRRIKNNSFNAVDVAGIDIRGTAKAPRISLFSEPTVSDADIISYIVTGSAITGGDIESRELTLGKYISPSFYVSFGYDLFEGNKSFNLRYDINNRWGIEGLAGDRDSGVDISFTLGR